MVQILPTDDDFAAGSPSYGSLSVLYLGCRVTTAGVGLWQPSAAGFPPRPMHGGYQTTNSYGVPDYNAAFYSNGTSTVKSPSAAIFRRPFGADVTVTGTFEMRSLAGPVPGLTEYAPTGVLARVSGGTLFGDGTDLPRLHTVDAYSAGFYEKASDGTLRFGVWRWNSGTPTVVGESASLPLSFLNLTALVAIKLVVSGTGATVTLTATATGLGSTVPLVLATSDSSGSRITVAGRCGFYMGSERVLSGVTLVDLCHLFAVDEGGVRVLQDEFRRRSLAGAKQTPIDAAGTPGSGYLSSGFFWDAASYDGTFTQGGSNFTGSRRLTAGSSAIAFDNQTTDDDGPSARHAPGRLIMSQRPATNRFSQHRTVTVTVPSAPTASTGEVWAGVVLRAAQTRPADQVTGAPLQGIANTPNAPFATGYALVCRAKTSTQVIWQLHRFVNNSQIAIARLTENSPFGAGFFPGYGVGFDIELDVHPRDAADPYGVVEIICNVDGVLLDMGPGTGGVFGSGSLAGITKASAGVYHDGSTARIQENPGEGMFVSNGLTSSGAAVNDIDPTFDDWTEGALTNAVVVDQDQPSVTVLPEPSATGTALTLAPDWEFETDHVSHHVSIPFDGGYRQTMPRYLTIGTDALVRRQVFRFRKRGVRESELDTLLDHWHNHDGLEAAFEFTPPGRSTVVVHYVEDTLQFDRQLGGVYDVEFTLEEHL